ERAVAMALHAGQRERAALYEIPAALWEGLLGNPIEAKRIALATAKHSKELYVQYGVAFALALAGDSAQAEAVAADLDKRFPEDTGTQFSYLPSVRARIALNRGDAAKALELLEIAVPYEMGYPRSAIHGNFGALYPVYLRGEAYLAARKGTK